MNTIGDTVSRVRNSLKAVKENAFITDRYLYSMILKYAKLFIKRQETEKKILRYGTLFMSIPCLELIEVDKVEACCGIKSNCVIVRTKDRLPKIMEGGSGPIIRSVTSIDGSIEVDQVEPIIYQNITKSTNYKFNKGKYYWYLDGYLYFPNLEWESIKIDAIWDDDIAYLRCNDQTQCTYRQDQNTNIPDYLFAEIEQQVMAELGFMIKAPEDNKDDKQAQTRT